ncbi:MAG: hypothetical protein KDK62_06745 [Chlamydiia bacterium]|nr:hypothetical protein [Chlamydiia bacterium]
MRKDLGGQGYRFELLKSDGSAYGLSATTDKVSLVGSDAIRAVKKGETLAVLEPEKLDFVENGRIRLLDTSDSDAPPLLMNVRAMTAEEEKEVDEIFRKVMLARRDAANEEHVESTEHEKGKGEKEMPPVTRLDLERAKDKEVDKSVERLQDIHRQMDELKGVFKEVEDRIQEARNREAKKFEEKMQSGMVKAQNEFDKSIKSNMKELNNDARADNANRAKNDGETVGVTTRAEVIREDRTTPKA